jgi:hypothetical protein
MCAKPRRLLVKFFQTIESDEEEEGSKEKNESVANTSDVTLMQ